MGKCKNATKGGSDTSKGISPTPSSHVGEAGDRDYVVHDLRDEVASLEDVLSIMDASSKMPFQITIGTIFFCLSIDKVTQHMKIRCVIASKLECL